MIEQRVKRQRVRKAVIFLSLLLLPITLNYLSPYLIIDSAFQGIINGSFIIFSLLFLSSLFFGRLWCSWLCPAAGLQEICFNVNTRPVRGGRFDLIKWVIWIPWFSTIIVAAVLAGGYHTVNFFYLTDGGISVSESPAYMIYYTVVGIFIVVSLTTGKRGGCHYVCWMAPFMIIGRKIRNIFKWPALHLAANKSKCINCKHCTENCPMSLDVNGMVQEEKMENSECILCGNCIDVCPQNVIRYLFDAG